MRTSRGPLAGVRLDDERLATGFAGLTGWEKLDARWTGVSTMTIMRKVLGLLRVFGGVQGRHYGTGSVAATPGGV